MNYTCFCFWLQGCFEIAEIPSFNQSHLELIKQHINLAKKVENNKPHVFINWLEGFLDNHLDEDMQDVAVEKIKNKLNDCFKHEIDGKFEKNHSKQELSNTHKPNSSWSPNSDKLIRC